MSRLVLIAGDFGRGTARYEAGEFSLPGRRLQNIVNVTAIEANVTVVEKHWGRAVMDGVRNAAGVAPVAMLVGVFAAPLAAVGTIGIAAAAVGAACGLLGGGAENKVLLQVEFARGSGLVAVCDAELARTIANDVAVSRAQAERQRRRDAAGPASWFGRRPANRLDEQGRESRPALPSPEPPEQSTLLDSAAETVSDAVNWTGQAWSETVAFVRRTTGTDPK